MKPQKAILIAFFSVALLTGLIHCASADVNDQKTNIKNGSGESQGGVASSGNSILGCMGTPLPEPWASRVEDLVKRSPWYGGVNPNWIQTPVVNHYAELTTIFKDASAESLILFAEHPVEYVRSFIQQEVQRRLPEDREKFVAAIKKGSPRIQFELSYFMNTDDYQTWRDDNKKYEYLNKILKIPNGKVYSSDFQMFSNFWYEDKNKYPVDMKQAYLRLLESEFIMDRIYAMENLSKFNDDVDEIVDALAIYVEKPDEYQPNNSDNTTRPSQRASACTAIGRFGEKAQKAIPVLKKALNDTDLKVRFYASAALYRIGYEPQAQIGFMSELMSPKLAPDDLSALLDSMLTAGIDLQSFYPMLAEFTRSDNKNVRQKAMRAIFGGPYSDFVYTVGLENLKSPNTDVRLETVTMLGYHRQIKRSSELLFIALKDSNTLVKTAACNALLNKGTSKSDLLPYMIEILSSSDKPVNFSNDIVREIIELGPDAKQAVPVLLKSVGTGSLYDTKYLIDAIIEIGGTSEAIVKRLIKVVKGGDSAASENAIMTLGDLGNKSIQALPVIREYIDELPDENSSKRDYKLHPQSKMSLESSFDKIVDSVKPGQKLPTEFAYHIMESGKQKNIERAINLLLWSGESWESIMAHMNKLLDSKNKDISQAIVEELGDLGNQSVSLIPDILKRAEKATKNEEEAYHYYKAINQIVTSLEPSDKDSVKYLLPLVGCDNFSFDLSRKASKKIYLISGSYDLVVDRLIEVLKKDNKQDRYKLVSQVVDLGTSSYKALHLLADLAREGDSNVEYSFMEIVRPKIQAKDERFGKDFILEYLDILGSFGSMSEYVNLYLQSGGSYDQIAVKLADCASSKNDMINQEAKVLLISLGVNAKSALPRLKELYQNENLDKKQKERLQKIIEEIQMAIQKAEKAK